MRKANLFLLTICLFGFSALTAHSQKLMPIRGLDGIFSKMNANEALDGRETYANIEGDPYMFKDFHQGKFTLRSGESYDLDMRYDIYADQVHIKYNNNIFGLSQPEKAATIKIDTVTFVYCNVAKKNGIASDKAFFILKTDGKFKLLIKKRVILQDAVPEKPMQPAMPAKFVESKDSYYLQLNNGNAVWIKNKKDLLASMNDKKDAISSFLDQKKINVSRVEDLVKIVEYYNTL